MISFCLSFPRRPFLCFPSFVQHSKSQSFKARTSSYAFLPSALFGFPINTRFRLSFTVVTTNLTQFCQCHSIACLKSKTESIHSRRRHYRNYCHHLRAERLTGTFTVDTLLQILSTIYHLLTTTLLFSLLLLAFIKIILRFSYLLWCFSHFCTFLFYYFYLLFFLVHHFYLVA